MSWLSNHRNWTGLGVVLYGTLFAGFTAFVVYQNQNLVASTIDVNGFGLLSRNLALGHGFSLGFGESIRRAPLYPLMGALLLKVFGQDAPGIPDAVAYRPIILLQCFLFGLTCLATWATARRLFGARVAAIAVLLCPLLPQSLRYVGQTEVETLMALLIALLAYTSLRFFERPSASTGALFGLTAAAATLTKPVTQLYPLFFLVLVWCVWYVRSRQPATESAFHFGERLRASMVVLACFALPILPWVARDWVVTNGQFVGISSNAPGETLRGYVAVQPKYYLLRQDFADWDPEANSYEEGLLNLHGVPFYRWNSPSAGSIDVSPAVPQGVASAMLDAQKDQVENSELSSRVLHQPYEFLAKFVIQLATFWYLVVNRTQSVIVGGIAVVVLALSALGVFRAYRQHTPSLPVVAIIVYLNLVYAGTLAMARYSMPIYPTLVVLAAGGLVALAPRRAAMRWPWRIVTDAQVGRNPTPVVTQLSVNQPGA